MHNRTAVPLWSRLKLMEYLYADCRSLDILSFPNSKQTILSLPSSYISCSSFAFVRIWHYFYTSKSTQWVSRETEWKSFAALQCCIDIDTKRGNNGRPPPHHALLEQQWKILLMLMQKGSSREDTGVWGKNNKLDWYRQNCTINNDRRLESETRHYGITERYRCWQVKVKQKEEVSKEAGRGTCSHRSYKCSECGRGGSPAA